jgi:hypothetical protein
MPALARGQENTPSIINWFITVSGVLTDAYSVGFKIFDITGGLPGTQVFPLTGYEEIVGSDGHFSVGSYYAYDVANTQGWTPELTQTIGTHRIEWRWKISVDAPYQSGYEDFEVLVQSAGSTTDTYITVQDVRDEGVPEEVDGGPSDAKVLSYIETWQAFIDRATRQWFVPKATIMSINGNESNLLQFSVPIISIDYVKLNDDSDELDTDLYRVYNGIVNPDDRRNPRIKLVASTNRDIYTRPYGRLLFRKGEQNQEIKGVWGYVEEDGTTPKLIQRALTKLVIEKLMTPIYESTPSTLAPMPPLLGPLLEERTDGHEMKYGYAGGAIKPRAPGLIGITQDQEILDIIRLYKGPIGIGAPTYRNIR